MAEIKSTMEMVMERAARMAAAAGGNPDTEADRKEGMRTAAVFMNGKNPDLMGVVNNAGETAREVLRGMVSVFLRNILLPQTDEQQTAAERGIAGLLNLAGNNAELVDFFGEMKKMLEQYQTHRQQMREQLEAGFSQQMQKPGGLAGQTGQMSKLESFPKFQEEWQRALDQLNGQYSQALDDHKAMVSRFLGVE